MQSGCNSGGSAKKKNVSAKNAFICQDFKPAFKFKLLKNKKTHKTTKNQQHAERFCMLKVP